MPSKDKLRKKFVLLRKRKHFFINKKFYNPLLKLLNIKKKRNISIYYPSNYEVDTLHLFKLLKQKNFSTSLPKLLPNTGF